MAEPSPLDRLRARYRALHGAAPQTFDLPIRRTAGGDLVAVYREPEWEEVEEIAERWRTEIADEPRAKLYGYAELLAKACVDILLRDDDDPDAVERKGLSGRYLPGMGLHGGPVSFHAAAAALELPVGDDPLVAVFSVLGGAHGGDYEVERHGSAVSEWEPRLSSPEVDERFVGESEAAPLSGASHAGT